VPTEMPLMVPLGLTVPPVVAENVTVVSPVEPELPELPVICMIVPSTVTILILNCSLGVGW